MKGFLRGILTIWIFLLLVVFGIVINLKTVLISTTDGIIKKEIKNNIVAVVEKNGEEIPKDVLEKVEKEINENEDLKKIMDKYYDEIVEVLDGNGTVQIDVAKEIETLIDNNEELLKQYDIVITEEQKKEILDTVSSSEINNTINETIVEIRDNMDSGVKTVIEVYTFTASTTFKLIVIGLIVISLVFIALLKRSYFKWLSNLSVSSILTGILFSLVPFLVTQFLADLIKESGITIDLASLSTYGYVLLGLGVLCIILNIVFSKIAKKQETQI